MKPEQNGKPHAYRIGTREGSVALPLGTVLYLLSARAQTPVPVKKP